MIYEMRIYRTVPGRLPTLMQRWGRIINVTTSLDTVWTLCSR